MTQKLTYDVLRQLYLADLEKPDTHHGRTTPKVRNLAVWKSIQPNLTHGSAVTIDPFGSRDVWVWSDIHWGHKNIIKYTDPFRPFNSVDEMNSALISNYRAVVKPDDIVIFGGDIGFMPVPAINAILHDLPGYKIQIVGNHDMDRKGNLMQLHFDERHLCMPIDVKDDEIDSQLLVSHYPIDTVPRGSFNLHGHIHQNLANEWNINMCVEHTGCAPKHIRDIVAAMKASPWNHK
jgi:calcineurin-like phosphoesterase family protein